MRAKLLPLVPLFVAFLLTLLPGAVRGDTVVPYGTIYADVPLDARVAVEFPNRLRSLVAQVNSLGAPFVSMNLDPTRLRLCFRAGPAPTTMEAIAPIVQALQQSGLVERVYPVEIGIPWFGNSATTTGEVTDDMLRGVVPVSQAPISETTTLAPHTPGLVVVSLTTFAQAGPNRATALAALQTEAAAMGVTLVSGLYGQTDSTNYSATFDPNRLGDLEVLRRMRTGSWATTALSTFLYPAIVLPPVKRYWLVSGQARPNASFETFLLETNDSQGGPGEALALNLGRQVYVPLRLRISPRQAGEAPIAGLERYAQPWVPRQVLAVGLADFGRPDYANLRDTPPFTAAPSEISADVPGWIAANGDILWTQKFKVVAQVQPGAESALGNLSTRAQVGRGERIVIGGFQVKGGSTRTLIIRAIGPSLSAHRIANPLSNPKLRIYAGEELVGENDDWQSGPRAAELQARFPQYAPADPREAALLATFYPGNYTVQLSGSADEEGVAVFELFDAPEQP